MLPLRVVVKRFAYATYEKAEPPSLVTGSPFSSTSKSGVTSGKKWPSWIGVRLVDTFSVTPAKGSCLPILILVGFTLNGPLLRGATGAGRSISVLPTASVCATELVAQTRV